MRVKLFLKPAELLSPKGRIARLTYLVNVVVFNIAFLALVAGSTLVAGLFDDEARDAFGWLLAPAALVAIALVYILFCTHAKRLHDLGVTGFVCVLMFAYPVLKACLALNGSYVSLPVDAVRWLDIFAKTTLGLSLLLQIVLLVVPGRHDHNPYGGNPRAA